MPAGYGAIDTSEPDDTERQEELKESDFIYFLKDKNATREDRLKKFILGAVPLVIAVILMGGIGFWLFKDFDHLYPGPSGSRSSPNLKPRGPPINSPQDSAPDYFPAPSDSDPSPPTTSNLKPRGPPIGTPVAPAPSPMKPPASFSSGNDVDCSAIPACNKLGLTGLCCPTGEGVMLGCCS